MHFSQPKEQQRLVEANNVLDTTYYDFTFIRQPGLWVVGGIKLKF